MKISPERQRDKLNSDSPATIRLVVSWEGKRLRIGSGCLAKPAHWDSGRQLVQMRPDTSHYSINPLLTNIARASDIARVQLLQTL